MDDDDSNDVMIIESNDEQPTTSLSDMQKSETRPIMLLFDRLITNDHKQNTILTNAQIISILQKEYNIDVSALHPLEVNIYLNIVKRFLKDWPQWEEFDMIINRLKKINATTSIKNILEHKYKNLKEYLRVMIEVTRPLAQKAAHNVPRHQDPNLDTSDIILEIYSSRRRLNELIYNQPHPDFNDTIFNFPGSDQKISVRELPVESILNWMDVKFSIDLKFFYYNRYTKHELKHVLVNEKLKQTKNIEPLNTNVQVQICKSGSVAHPFNRNTITCLVLDQILEHCTPAQQKDLACFFNVIKSDLEVQENTTVRVPGLYRQHSNKYPYIRKLYKPIEKKGNRESQFDLYIQEKISPMHIFYIGKVGSPNKVESKQIPTNLSWIRAECMICKESFTGSTMRSDLVEHFNTYHSDEPDWECTNCGKSFTMIELTYRKWRHVCEKQSN